MSLYTLERKYYILRKTIRRRQNNLCLKTAVNIAKQILTPVQENLLVEQIL